VARSREAGKQGGREAKGRDLSNPDGQAWIDESHDTRLRWWGWISQAAEAVDGVIKHLGVNVR
jgi:hypothetical protein